MSSGPWQDRPGLGVTVEDHPLYLSIRQMLVWGVRPRWIVLILRVRFMAELRAGVIPPLPSVRTVQRFLKYRLPASQLGETALGRRVAAIQNARARAASGDTFGGEKRQRLIAAVNEEMARRSAAEAQLLALGAAKRR